MRSNLPNELTPKPCKRPILVGNKVWYDDVFCPIADRCKIKDYRDRIFRIEAKRKSFFKRSPSRIRGGRRWKPRYYGVIGCSDAIHRTLKKEGYFVVQSGRANIIAMEDKMKDKYGYDVKGIRLLVMGDPDSGVFEMDEVFITGDRFGVDDILVRFNSEKKFRPIFSVHGNFSREEEEIAYLIERLLTHLSLRKQDENVKRYVEFLKEIAEYFGAKVNFGRS